MWSVESGMRNFYKFEVWSVESGVIPHLKIPLAIPHPSNLLKFQFVNQLICSINGNLSQIVGADSISARVTIFRESGGYRIRPYKLDIDTTSDLSSSYST